MHGDNQGDVREICTAGIDKFGKNWEVSLPCVPVLSLQVVTFAPFSA